MAETMRAALLMRPGQIEIYDVPVPEPGEGEVLVRVRAVGICGSDIHFFAGHVQKETEFPLVLGHEFAGEVTALGPGVEGVELHARVACAPDRPCGKCEWCRKGETNVCPNVRFAASHGEPGCLSEYCVVHASQLYRMAQSLEFDEAALFEPMATGLHIVENLVKPRGGESYAIMGAGPDGLTALCTARRNGAAAVYVSDLVPERLEAAVKMGADEVCNARDQDFIEFLLERTRGRGVDVAIEAAGAVPAIQQVFLATAIHGRAVVLGIPRQDTLEINLTAARRRELTFIAARRTVGKYARALEYIEKGWLDTGVMITHRFPLDRAQEAFELARDRRDGVLKAMIVPQAVR